MGVAVWGVVQINLPAVVVGGAEEVGAAVVVVAASVVEVKRTINQSINQSTNRGIYFEFLYEIANLT